MVQSSPLMAFCCLQWREYLYISSCSCAVFFADGSLLLILARSSCPRQWCSPLRGSLLLIMARISSLTRVDSCDDDSDSEHIHKHKERLLQRELENRKGRPHMTLLGDANQSNGYIISAAATRGRSFQRGRSASPKRSHSSGGRLRPTTPKGRHYRSRSRSAGGTRKPRPCKGSVASPAFSATTGKYNSTPRGGT